jgi:hypothetical protein
MEPRRLIALVPDSRARSLPEVGFSSDQTPSRPGHHLFFWFSSAAARPVHFP